VLSLKDGRLVGQPPETVSSRVARHLHSIPTSGVKFSESLAPTVTLVPVPKSSLLTKGGLWVPERLAEELVKVGLGNRVARLLERTEAIPKAATSVSTERPTALQNYQTLRVRRELDVRDQITLVDDVVTTGAALLGSANRLVEGYPNAHIRGFAAARTISGPSDFRRTIEPVLGKITLRPNGRTLREP
jgi:predicted amidophosphoribosyltransferase